MSRQRTVAAIAAIIGSYRQGTVPPLDEEHIERWVSAFDEKVQMPILTELAHVLPRTYITREAFGAFFADAITNSELAGTTRAPFGARRTSSSSRSVATVSQSC
jgi:hypothetical protein